MSKERKSKPVKNLYKDWEKEYHKSKVNEKAGLFSCPVFTWNDVKEEFRHLPAKEIKSTHFENYTEPVFFFYGSNSRHCRMVDALEDDDVYTGDMSKLVEAIKASHSFDIKIISTKMTIGDLLYAETVRAEKEEQEKAAKAKQDGFEIEAKTRVLTWGDLARADKGELKSGEQT